MPELSMPIFDITPRHALAGKKPTIHNGVNLEPLFEGHVVHVLARVADGDITAFLQGIAGGSPFVVRPVSPGQWFIVGDKTLTHAETQTLIASLKPKADGVDQSHGRVRIALHGPKAMRVLAKGTAADLALPAFPIGNATTTSIGHISAHLTRTEADRFEIIVLRGFAESLWDDLAHMSREFV
jgi:sarcosine oxidase subunit gamma